MSKQLEKFILTTADELSMSPEKLALLLMMNAIKTTWEKDYAKLTRKKVLKKEK